MQPFEGRPFMIAGLHWTAWLLLLLSFGIGLTIELVFYFRHRKR